MASQPVDNKPTTDSGKEHHLPHYHMHKPPQYAFPHGDDHRPLTPEQNAANLATYQREHADQLAANAAKHQHRHSITNTHVHGGHGGYSEGDEYHPSKGAHHHAHFWDFLKPAEEKQEQSGVYDGVKGPLFQKHEN